jgi:hypothetical protein
MAEPEPDSRANRLSYRLYGVLLRAYPAPFRAAYGEEMRRAFRDLLRERRRAGESWAGFWLHMLHDVATSALRERGEEMDRGRKVRLALALCAGWMIAWVDSRPHWNDSGISAMAVLCTSAIFGFAEPPAAWIWALAVGAWIPLLGILHRGDLSMLLVLLFPFVGAYGGALLRRLLRPPVTG